jgi:hypothetical protein
MIAHRRLVVLLTILAGTAWTAGCAETRKEAPPPAGPRDPGPPPVPKISLVAKPVAFQDQVEPWVKKLDFEFDLAQRPRRARLVLRYSGVPGALSDDYKMGRFRDRVEINGTFLMDLNTFSKGEEQVVEYTKWISVLLLKAHNKLSFISGDDGNRDDTPRIHGWELRHAELEFDY